MCSIEDKLDQDDKLPSYYRRYVDDTFGRAMVRTLGRTSLAEIPMATPNEPNMPSKCTTKVWLGIYRTWIRPNEHQIVALSGQWLDHSVYRESWRGFWLANWQFGYDNLELGPNYMDRAALVCREPGWRAFVM